MNPNQPELGLQGQTLLVTGASVGIGLETARVCLERGARVLLAARASGPLDKALDALRGLGEVEASGCDVTQSAELEVALDLLESRFGPLDGAIHAAGVQGPVGPAWEIDPEQWWETLRINLFGTYIVARQCILRFLRHARPGRLVLFSGGGATTSLANYTAYGCSKFGVLRLAESLALELAPHQIEVNCVAPGAVKTHRDEKPPKASSYLRRLKEQLEKGGTPPRVGAEAAAFLVSPQARGITGKLVSPLYDDYLRWPERLRAGELTEDMFALRRVVPRDRGHHWQ